MNDTQTSEPGLINLEEHRRCLEAHEIYMQFKPDDVRRKVFACFEDEIWKKLPSKDQERCIPYWQRNKKDQPNQTTSTNITAVHSDGRHIPLGMIDYLEAV
ncbi:hypothetical protein A3D88_00085 [Candidatus Peribacteria bacterium RIFCSPHIGHO2_02_FULL_52_16]|nr:MAG: hypothetical protein A2706_04930 [Candidatus Peribacteria bacterium RIFCSPHIGHO2_01_FULL_51_35]OGJ61523.1 MAG: hypothetical protein A3D88_00085 [Candidatus Peribacteria bacterium RIFCSPHIGHO2_02_FULL_52_16]